MVVLIIVLISQSVVILPPVNISGVADLFLVKQFCYDTLELKCLSILQLFP